MAPIISATVMTRIITAAAMLDCFFHHAQIAAFTGRSYRQKTPPTSREKRIRGKRIKSKPNELSTADPAS